MLAMNRQTKVFLGVVVVVVGLIVGIPFASALASPGSTMSAPSGFVIPSTPHPCASVASAPALQVEANRTVAVGKPVCLHGVFTNTGTTPIDLSDLTFNINVANAQGTTVYSTSCDVLARNAVLTPGHTWDCRAYWTAGPAGLYYLRVNVHSVSQNRDLVSANATITTY